MYYRFWHYQAFTVIGEVRNMKRILCVVILIMLVGLTLVNGSYAEVDNTKEVGLLLGDPIAVSINIPVGESTFVNAKAGIWAWHFWEPPVTFDTFYSSTDYNWRFSFENVPFDYYIGGGIALFFADSPKDDDDSDVEIALRVPIGIEFYKKDNITIGLEVAPVHQVYPWYVAEPYGIELNGGLIVHYAF
jgi:hypothetical protein